MIYYFHIKHKTKRDGVVSYCLDHDNKIDLDVVYMETVLETYPYVTGMVVPALGPAFALVMVWLVDAGNVCVDMDFALLVEACNVCVHMDVALLVEACNFCVDMDFALLVVMVLALLKVGLRFFGGRYCWLMYILTGISIFSSGTRTKLVYGT